jgi:hypothetical protein
MTTFLGLVLSLSLLSSPKTNVGIENKHALGQTERVATNESTFTVQNTTSENVGFVTVQEADQGNVQIAVTGQGAFSASLTASAVGCSINGQALTQGTPVKIVINDHTTVRATWNADIIVIDQDEKI